MSDTPRPDDKAEPVDAEFEPAPGAQAKPAKAQSGRRPPWLTIALVTVFAGGVGGGVGWLMGRYAPDPAHADLASRVAALEAHAETSDNAGAVAALNTRLDGLEAQLSGAQLRADGLEQLVRDVARLRTQLNALSETRDAPPAAESGLDAEALGRIDAALAELTVRLDQAEANAETARADADQAQAAMQQALSLIAETGAGDGAASSTSVDPAVAAALAQAEARLTAMETAQAAVNAHGERLVLVEGALVDIRQALNERADGAPDWVRVNDRLEAVEARLAALAIDGETPQPDQAERAVAFAALSRAASSDEPFPVALADLQRVWPGAPGASGLTLIAATGAATSDQLLASFPSDAVRAGTGEARLLFGVIRIERESETGPTDAIEAALATGDLAAAVNAAAALELNARDAAADWLAAAEARLTVDQTLGRMSAALSESEGARR